MIHDLEWVVGRYGGRQSVGSCRLAVEGGLVGVGEITC